MLRLRHDQFTAPAKADARRPAVLAAVAVWQSCDGSVVSHRSAALVHGLPLLDALPARPDLTVQPGRTGDVAGALLHRATTPPGDIVQVDGIAVTSVPRALVDLGRTVSLAAAVVSIDAALHSGLADSDELAEISARCSSWQGAQRARRGLLLSDACGESPLESVSRLVFRELALPQPDLQVVLRDEHGTFLGRADFYWDEFGVVGEADGRAKYDSRDVLTREKLTQESLEQPGLVVVRWGWADVQHRRQSLAARIWSAFERGRRRDASAFPRSWSVASG